MSSVGVGLRMRILHRDGFKCQYCGAEAPDVRLEVDHVIPRSKGGSNRPSNLVTACAPCNRGKLAQSIFPPKWEHYEKELPPEPKVVRQATEIVQYLQAHPVSPPDPRLCPYCGRSFDYYDSLSEHLHDGGACGESFYYSDAEREKRADAEREALPWCSVCCERTPEDDLEMCSRCCDKQCEECRDLVYIPSNSESLCLMCREELEV